MIGFMTARTRLLSYFSRCFMKLLSCSPLSCLEWIPRTKRQIPAYFTDVHWDVLSWQIVVSGFSDNVLMPTPVEDILSLAVHADSKIILVSTHSNHTTWIYLGYRFPFFLLRVSADSMHKSEHPMYNWTVTPTPNQQLLLVGKSQFCWIHKSLRPPNLGALNPNATINQPTRNRCQTSATARCGWRASAPRWWWRHRHRASSHPRSPGAMGAS